MTPPALAGLLVVLALTAVPAPGLAQPRPGPPGDLQAEAVSQTEIELQWDVDDRERSVSYNVYRDGNRIANTSEEHYTDTGLTAGTRYTYRVRGVDNKGREGSQSNEASATTFPDDTPPSKPPGLTATPTSSDRIALAWSASADPESGVSGYRVHRDGSVVATVTGTSYEDSGLQPFTEYEYRVSALNGEGIESKKSNRVTVRTLDGSPPTTPTDVTATATSATVVSVTWSASTDPETGVAEYRVFRDGSLVATPQGTSYSDDGLEAETQYEYRVAAVNGEGLVGSLSDPAPVTTPRAIDDTPPTAPAGLQARAASPRQVSLFWSASTDPESGVAGYRVYRDDALVGSPEDASFEDASVEPDTEYRYHVTAVNVDWFESGPSDEVTVTTPRQTDDTPPTAPGSLAATSTSPTRVDLQWTAASDAESGIDHYRVYREDVLIDVTTGLTYGDEGLSPGTTYTYQVSAVNGDGLEGPGTGPASATTPLVEDTVAPAPPSGSRVVIP